MVVKQLKTASSMQGSLFSWIIFFFVINVGTFCVADVETVLRKVGENVTMESPSTPRITHVSSNGAHSFYVHWEAPLETNGKLYKYKVKWSDAYGATKARVIAGQLTNPMEAYITHLQPYSRYNVQVSASTRHGGDGPFTQEYPAMTDVAAPSHPRNLSITDISKTAIHLKWEEPEVIYKKVDQYLIKIWDDHGDDFNITIPGRLTQLTVDKLRTDSRYNVKVAGITNAIFRKETPLMGDWSDSIIFFTLGEKSESDRDGATECAEGHYNCRHASVKSYMNDVPYCCFDEKQIAHKATVSPVHGGLESSCTCSYASPKSSSGC